MIPKPLDPQSLNDFWPISLVGCLYKIVTKVLASRLRKVLVGVIDSAFLTGRHLLYSVLVANKVVDEARRLKRKCLVFKVDFEKAGDSINWRFLFYMLKRLGFNDKWIWLIKGCLISSRVSILVNGSPTKEFSISKGL